MRRPLARQRALRALAEGARASLELLADASSRSLQTLRRDAEREGWRLDRLPDLDFHERLMEAVKKLTELAGELARKLAGGEAVERKEIDTLFAMIRAIDKLSGFHRPEEMARQRQVQRDEDLAAVLDRINARIIELAHEIAAQMVAEARGNGGGGPGKVRLGRPRTAEAISTKSIRARAAAGGRG